MQPPPANNQQFQTASSTDEFYGLMETAFMHFSEALFEGVLQNCVSVQQTTARVELQLTFAERLRRSKKKTAFDYSRFFLVSPQHQNMFDS